MLKKKIGVLLILPAFGLADLWPELGAQFVLVDDHEILSLTPPVGAEPDARPQLDLHGMAFISDPSVGRFRPLYWAIRFGEISLFRDNPHAWHALVLCLGIVSSGFLYGTGRALGVDRLASLLLGAWLLVAPGVSSLWVRLGADDTLATVFFTVALFAAAHGVRRGRSVRWDVLLVAAGTAMLLSKEAFALAAIAVAVFRMLGPIGADRAVSVRTVSAAGVLLLCLGVAATVNAALVGASAGPLSYGGRYLAVPDLGSYLRAVAQNAAILGFVGIFWLAPLIALGLQQATLPTNQRGRMVLASGFALLLIGPQVLLYSQQGIFEGKYEAAGAIGVALWSMAGLVMLKTNGLRRLYLAGIGIWCVTISAFAFGTWTYAGYFAEDSVQLGHLTEQVTTSAAAGSVVGIAADPARQYEPIESLIVHIAHRGRSDLTIKVLPLVPDRPYTPLEASFAETLANSRLGQPPLTESNCRGLGSMIVLGDAAQAHTNLPCLDQGFRRIDFSATVLLWGGEGVSLRPRMPGLARVGYVVLVPTT
jgi:hypothetical protein